MPTLKADFSCKATGASLIPVDLLNNNGGVLQNW